MPLAEADSTYGDLQNSNDVTSAEEHHWRCAILILYWNDPFQSLEFSLFRGINAVILWHALQM